MSHWQAWASGFALLLLPALLSVAFPHLGLDDSMGFGLGFIIAVGLYGWTLHKIGLPHYQKLLKAVQEQKPYTVRAGDSWAQIAEQFNISVPTLLELNPKAVTSPLVEGQILRVTKTVADE